MQAIGHDLVANQKRADLAGDLAQHVHITLGSGHAAAARGHDVEHDTGQ